MSLTDGPLVPVPKRSHHNPKSAVDARCDRETPMGVIMKNPHIGSLTLGAAILSCLILAAPASAADQTVIEEWATVKAPPPPKIEAVKIDPKTTALLVMDFNKKSCVPARRARCAAILPKMHKLLTEARAHKMLVIHTTS